MKQIRKLCSVKKVMILSLTRESVNLKMYVTLAKNCLTILYTLKELTSQTD